MANVQEITAQVVSRTRDIQVLKNRLAVTEQDLSAVGTASPSSAGPGNSGNSGVFDKKRLYPEKLKDGKDFRSWAEDVLQWIAMDNDEIAKAFEKAGKQEQALNLGDMNQQQAAYAKAVHAHLRSLTQGMKKAARIVRSVSAGNGLEAWRRLVRKFDPQHPEVHAMKLTNLITYGTNHKTNNVTDVPAILDEFNKTLLRHLETVADSVAATRDGFETLGEQVAVVAGQTDAAVGRVEQSAAGTLGASQSAQQATLADLARQSAQIEAHFKRLAEALGQASSVRIDQSLGRIDRAVDRLAEAEDAPQTLFAYLRDGLARRRPRARRVAPEALATPRPTTFLDPSDAPTADPADLP